MRSSFASSSPAPRRGVRLMKTPSHRQQMAKRRWMVAGGMLALALVSGAVGVLTARPDPGGAVETGPFSYFPYQ